MLDRQTDEIRLSNNTQRIVYLDYLRIVAIFAVVVLHVSGYSWSMEIVNSFSWQICNIYRGTSQWGVAIFVMISGALFLSKKISLKKLYKKYIFRIAVAFIFWSTLYAFWSNFYIDHNYNINGLITTIVFGHYHLWFMYMIIGIYMVVPFLRKIVEEKRIAYYFIVVSFVFAFFVPEITHIIGIINNDMSKLFNDFVAQFDLHLVLGYSGFFVLGYLLNDIEIKKKYRIVIYVFGIIGLIFSVSSSSAISWILHAPTAFSYDNITIENLMVAISIYVFAKTYLNKDPSLSSKKGLLFNVPKCSFGVYLVHPFIIESLEQLNITALSFNSLFSIPVLSILVYCAALLVSAGLNKIPFVNKWIV